MATSDDGGCAALLVASGAAAVFLMAPYLSLTSVSGESGTFAAIAASMFLVLSVLAPFLPTVGAVIGFQWMVYALWLAGYFDLVGGWITAITTWSDPYAGIDGFLLSLLLLVPLIIAMVGVYLAIPAAVGIAGGLLINLPAATARNAWRTNPFPLWSRYTFDPAFHGTTNEFRATRWSAAHRRTADRSLTRRQRLLIGSAVLYVTLAGAALLLVFGTELTPMAKTTAYAAVFLTALALAGLQRWTAGSVARDFTDWSLPDDPYSALHTHTVQLANQWAAAVHSDDRRDGRPLMASLLNQSQGHMDDAQRLVQRATRESVDAGPGWDPPSRRELAEAHAALVRVQRGVEDIAAAAAAYQRDQAARARRSHEDRWRARLDEDTEILAATADVYTSAYDTAWQSLDGRDGAAGLPHPSFRPWDGCFPDDLPAADLPPHLAAILARVTGCVTDVAQSPDAPGTDRAVVRFLEAARLLRRAADLAQAANVRLTLLDQTEHSHAGVDDQIVTELIHHLQARTAAENEVGPPMTDP